MNLILADYLGRRWWWLLAVSLYYLPFFTSLREVTSLRPDETVFMMLGLTCVLANGILFSWDLGLRRASGVFLTLPLSARRFGQTCWLCVVALPSLSLAVVLGGLCAVGSASFSQLSVLLPGAVLMISLGALFLSGLDTPSVAVKALTILGFCGAMWAAPNYLPPWLPPDSGQAPVLAAAACVAAWLSWVHSESMVRALTEPRNLGQVRVAPLKARRATSEYGGIPYLIQSFLYPMVAATVTMAVALLAGTHLGIPASGQPGAWESGQQTEFADFCVISSVTGLIPFLRNMSLLRFLRTLPMSALVLATALVLTPVVAVLISWLGVAILAVLVFHERFHLYDNQVLNSVFLCAMVIAAFVTFEGWTELNPRAGIVRWIRFEVMLLTGAMVGMFVYLGADLRWSPLLSGTVALLVVVVAIGLMTKSLRDAGNANRRLVLP